MDHPKLLNHAVLIKKKMDHPKLLNHALLIKKRWIPKSIHPHSLNYAVFDSEMMEFENHITNLKYLTLQMNNISTEIPY